MIRKPFRLAAVTISALAITTLGVSAPVFAEDVDPSGGAAAANVALINDDALANLHITKYSGGDNGTYANGLPGGAPTSPANAPLAGVTYKIYQVPGVDLTTNAGWEAAATYYTNGPATAKAAIDAASVAGVTSDPTDVNGQVSLTNLPVGLYYVEEVSAPAGYTMAAPFLVTLPMTNPSNTSEWMYDVYVYPKNQNDTITKTVDDMGTQTTDNATGAAADHVIDYTLTSSITDGTDPLGMYVIYDDLDARLTFTGADVTLGTDTLVAGTDYKVYTSTGINVAATQFTVTAVEGGPLVTIVFTDAGLAKLQANRSLEVKTVLHTTVGAEDADGIIPNTGSFIPNQNWWDQNMIPGTDPSTPYNPEDPTTPWEPETPGTPPTTPGIPSDQVESKYGDVQITKVDGGEATKLLAGAEFTVYKDANNNEACDAAEMVDDNKIGGPVTTDASGVALFKGLQTSDFYNNATQTDLLTYCMVETKAPTGYNLNADPITFTVMQKADGTLALTAFTVKNEKSNLGNSLPLTGGEGIAALSLGGLALIGGGAGYYAFTSRKRREA